MAKGKQGQDVTDKKKNLKGLFWAGMALFWVVLFILNNVELGNIDLSFLGGEEERLKDALILDDENAYRGFLAEYPEGEYAALVKKRLEEVKPRDGLYGGLELYRTDRIAAYQEFLDKYPHSLSRPYIKLRIKQLESLAESSLPKSIKIGKERLSFKERVQTLSIKDQVAPFFRALGVKVVDADQDTAEATLDIKIAMRALGGTYAPAVGQPGGLPRYMYTGAQVDLSLNFASSTFSELKELRGTYSPPQQHVLHDKSTPGMAPFASALKESGLQAYLGELLVSIYGPEAAAHLLKMFPMLGIHSQIPGIEKLLVAQGSKIRTALLALLHDEDPAVPWTAARALGKIGGPGVREALVALIEENRPSPAAAGLARIARAAWNQDRERGHERATKVSQILWKVDTKQRTREAAMEGLASLDDPLAVAGLIHCLTDPDEGIRARVIKLLEPFPGPEVTAALQNSTTDAEVSIAFDAAWALGRRKDPNAAKYLLRLMDSRLKEFSLSYFSTALTNSVAMLGELKAREALPHLFRLLGSSKFEVREAAARALLNTLGQELPFSKKELLAGKAQDWWQKNQSRYRSGVEQN